MRAALTIPLLLACAAGCGGVDRGRPSADYETGGGAPPSTGEGGAPAVDCEADEGLEFALIEDFEDGYAQQWWISGDGTPGAIMDPPDGEQGYPANELDEPRCASTTALRIRAEGLKIYGGAFGKSFLTTATPTGFDVRDWEGLSLWVKRNPDARGRSFYVALNDPQTDGSSWKKFFPDEPTENLVCDDRSLVESEKCDRFGLGVALEEQWRLVKIPFDAMKQRGFGVPVEELDLEHITGINISFEAGDWDFYIDDAAFYRVEEAE